MFKNRKLEIRLKKDGSEDGLYEMTPSITKDEIIEISKNVARHVIGGILIVLAGAAVIDTVRYDALMAIDQKRSPKEED